MLSPVHLLSPTVFLFRILKYSFFHYIQLLGIYMQGHLLFIYVYTCSSWLSGFSIFLQVEKSSFMSYFKPYLSSIHYVSRLYLSEMDYFFILPATEYKVINIFFVTSLLSQLMNGVYFSYSCVLLNWEYFFFHRPTKMCIRDRCNGVSQTLSGLWNVNSHFFTFVSILMDLYISSDTEYFTT